MIVRVIPPPGVVPRDWLTTQLPDVPRIGETVDIDGEQFTVAAVRWLIELAHPDSALMPEVGLERIDDLAESPRCKMCGLSIQRSGPGAWEHSANGSVYCAPEISTSAIAIPEGIF